jgi:hypothetical protein
MKKKNKESRWMENSEGKEGWGLHAINHYFSSLL